MRTVKKHGQLPKPEYSFDSKGRMKKGIVTLPKKGKAYFSKKNGRYLGSAMELKVIEKYKYKLYSRNIPGTVFRSHSSTAIINDRESYIARFL